MNKQITVNDLKKHCEEAIKKGLGDRMIVVSDDNEGNGFHGLFFGFTVIKKGEEDYFPISDSVSEDIKEIIVLG